MPANTYTKKVLIVDDELPALINMQEELHNHPDWTLLASCRSTREARAVMREQQVDLILLDIEMPDQSGLDFAREFCHSPNAPLIVFITAYDQHAVSAFDVFALDYLLKPFDDLRFAQMLSRASQSLELKQHATRHTGLSDYLRDRAAFDAGQAAPAIDHIVVRSVGSLERIALAEVLWFSAAANYVEIHLPKRTVLHRATLQAMEARLPEGQFIRLHRTAIVRTQSIIALKSAADGSSVAQLSNGDLVRISDSYLKRVKKLFG
jgi:two-component system, LytTR family, response regulator